MATALYLNGVYESVLQEILAAQAKDPSRVCCLQPYSPNRITLLADAVPTEKSPVRFYASTTTHLASVCYMGDVVGWEDKSKMTPERIATVSKLIQGLQPSEKEVYLTANGKKCVNLTYVKNVVALKPPLPVTVLTKTEDGTPLKPRTRAGNWAYVHPLADWVGTLDVVLEDWLTRDLNAAVAKSTADSADARKARLASASKMPQRIQIISQGFRRNADVVAEVLLRANGRCEGCGNDAPFRRALDGSPFLEIHHVVPLADGGEDALGNAQALCPNCHRRMHFGVR